MKRSLAVLVLLALGDMLFLGNQVPATVEPEQKPILDVVALAHLDTQWRWTIQNTINDYVPATFRENFRLMDRFPDYTFSFEGAFKYMLLKEYYPEEYRRLKSYVDAGRWRLAGSWIDAVDVNMPSFESLVRQTLYGNGYFRKEFGRRTRDILLPDCFGFGYALPSIAAHCGLSMFSTQKLSWGSSVGIPFDIGIWEGVDGSTLMSALNPGSYVGQIRGDLSRDTSWVRRIEHQKRTSGLAAGYMYFGTGDTGGSPDSASVDWLQESIRSDGPISVRSVGSEDLALLAGAETGGTLPRYRGELLMTRHGAGCYTSQAAMKRWNRRNELLADAVERASVIAHVVGGVPYPREALRETWTGFLWHQFHDDLTGTSIPEAYEFSWNDEILCQNRFAGLLEHAVATTALALDTQVRGSPIVVFNPLSMPREDIVEATVCFPGGRPPFVRVFDPRNREVPAQSAPSKGDSVRVVFLAMAPPVGYAVYDLRPSKTMCPLKTGLRAAQRTLESQRYVVTLDSDGDVSSVLDKANRRRLLTRPIAYQLLHDKPRQWPAWEIQYEDIIATPQGYVGGPAVMRVIENGPARVAIEVTRRTPRSRFRTIISLTAGGNRVEFDNQVDWYESETLLKAAFPLTAANQAVTYDLGLGVIQRGVNTPQKYEVPAHQWADLTSPAGDFGVAVLNDCKYGWDHPDSGTLRLSLIHTPGVHESWQWVGDQRSQDQGRHTFRFSLLGHRGDWREGKVIDQAARLNQPLLAFRTPQHKGELGREYSLLSLHPDKPAARPRSEVADVPAIVTAVKMAEDSREIVIRVREVNGHPLQNLWVRFARPVVSAREVNGAEEPLGPARVIDGALVISLGAFQPRAFAVSLREDTRRGPTGVTCANLALPFNEDGISTDADRRDGDFDGFGNTLSGDLLPDTLVWKGVSFAFGPKRTGSLNVVGCTGEEIRLPPSSPSRLCLLATAVGGPAKGTFKIGEAETTVWLQDYSEHLGQWNNRLVNGVLVEEPHRIAPAYVNQLPVGYVGSHRHNGRGENDAYRFTYCYALDFRVPPGVLKVTLPDDRRIKVLAATLVSGPWNEVSPAQPLVDTASATVTAIHPERTAFLGQTAARITCPNPGAEIRYTVDGSEPTPHSTRYQGPITVTETCVLKTRAFLPGADDDFVGSLQFSRLVPKEPLQAVAVEPGLRCRYYEREWSKLPNFDLFAAKQRLLTKTIAIPPVARPENYGLVFEGLVSVAQEGIYDFWISSDDGSILVVADSLLVNNDGLHGPGEVGGSMALKPGLHRIKVCMFQAQGGQDLRVFIAGPGVQKQLLPESMLWHARGPG